MSQQPAAAKPAALSVLDKPARSHSELRSLLTSPSVLEQIKQTLPKHMTPERLAKVMLSACLQTPKLMEVNQLTLLRALMSLSELGLEPGAAWGHVYLLPFRNNKAGRTDLNIIIGYRGYIELARRSGWVEQIETHVVFEGEEFDLVYGLEDTRKLRHVPSFRIPRTPEKAIAVYCIVRLKGGGSHVEIMSMDEVRNIRNRSQSWKFKPNEGPWHDDFIEMSRKTVIRRAQKYLPLSPEIRDAMELEENDETVTGTVSKPELKALSSTAGDDLAAQMTAASEPTGETVDQDTGEVTEAAPQEQANEEQAPEAGTIDHLLWRIARADVDQLAGLIKEAADLPKDEPRRLEVGTAVSARRKAVRS